jgi:predicted ATPase
MEPSHFRLTRVRLRHYRSIAEADVRLGSLVFLVGPNGSGKSNFVDALRLVSDALNTSMEQALRERGGVAQVRRRSPGHPAYFSVELSFEGPGLAGTYAVQVASARQGGFRIAGERCEVVCPAADSPAAVASAAGGAAAAEPSRIGFRVENGQVAATTERALPATEPQRLLLPELSRRPAFRQVYEGLAGLAAFNLSPQAMREPRAPEPGRALRRDGSNVASVLHRLGRTAAGKDDRKRLDSYLQQIVPGIRSARRRALGDAETVEFAQDVPGSAHPWRFTAPSVSDGTLRALGVLVALFARTEGGYGVVAIEEPETALHPTVTAVLLAALRDAADRRQVIVTSHSPDLLDHEDVDAGELRAVRSDQGRTVIGPLDEEGAFALRAQLHTAGQLLRTGRLVPRPTSPEAPFAEPNRRP